MKGTVVTFYSYKGGVGRTFLLANLACNLARWGYRVLCVDWDLEAPGLYHYFRPWVLAHRPGIVDLAREYEDGLPVSRWMNYLTRANFKSANASLDLIVEGNQGNDYHARVQEIDWRKLYEEGGFGNYLENVRAEWKRIYDFVLVDSRTGVSDLSGITTVHLPDVLVFSFTSNSQSIEGASKSAERMIQSRNSLPYDRERLQCLPILSRFATDKEYEISKDWLSKTEVAMQPFYADWVPKEVDALSVIHLTRIPEVAYWTFGEGLPVIEDESSNSDPSSINFAVNNISALVARRFSGLQQLILNRDAYLAGARKSSETTKGTASLSGNGLRAYISSGTNESARAKGLADNLTSLGVQTRGPWDLAVAASWRDAVLDELSSAKFLIVMVTGPLSEQQSAEIETFFSLNVRDGRGGAIVPVLMSDSFSALSSPLSSYQFIDGRKLSTEEIAEVCYRAFGTSQSRSISNVQFFNA